MGQKKLGPELDEDILLLTSLSFSLKPSNNPKGRVLPNSNKWIK